MAETKKKQHGGPRTAGPGKKMGKPSTPLSRNVAKSIKVSAMVAAYLKARGTGIIEDELRASEGFKAFVAARASK